MYTSTTGWADGPIFLDVRVHGFAAESDAMAFGNGVGERYANGLAHEVDAVGESCLVLLLSTGERITLLDADVTILRDSEERSDALVGFPDEQEIVHIPLKSLVTLTRAREFDSMSYGVGRTEVLNSYYDYLHAPISAAERERRSDLVSQAHELFGGAMTQR